MQRCEKRREEVEGGGGSPEETANGFDSRRFNGILSYFPLVATIFIAMTSDFQPRYEDKRTDTAVRRGAGLKITDLIEVKKPACWVHQGTGILSLISAQEDPI